jgi:multiple sugar transport system ATP-binding protein
VVNNLPPNERDIAMVFQNYALYPHKTVRREHGLLAQDAAHGQGRDRPRGGPRRRDPRAHAYLDRYPRALSGGQRQRVAMGRAIVRDPQVFLFDEPLSNLDAKLRVQMRAEIRELHQRLKTTTVYVTHDQIEAMTMADKIVVLNGGIEQIGAPLELYDRPGQHLRRELHRLAVDEPDARHRMHVLSHFGPQEIVAVFRERHLFKAGATDPPDANARAYPPL